MNMNQSKFEKTLVEFYQKNQIPQNLSESIIYSLQAGGKRIRPMLFLEMLSAFGVALDEAHYQVAAAIEWIHTGSLIHDDLPAMDNDDYRRGKLTNHKVYGEDTAILAGDALFLEPYYLLAQTNLSPEIKISLIKELSYASGSQGMVAGQVLDMAGESKSLSLEEIKEIHELKTGRMLAYPFVAAGIVAEQEHEQIGVLRQIGQNLGLAFQIRDDILDVTGSFEEIGKTPGKDEATEKSTYVNHLGLTGAKEALQNLLINVKFELEALVELKNTQLYNLIESLEIK
ncbi:MAG: polyprenyl synthetase family protein [Streptococcaceae bacterium]|nr:polyprenyl synthetase family protein [Streptococcaceae bacterium]